MLSKMTLGRTGMEVTRLGYGAAMRWTPDEDNMEKVLNTVLDAGINFIDTSWCYQNPFIDAPSTWRFQSSEEFIGHYIGHRRNEYFLSTKCGHFWNDVSDHSGPQSKNWGRDGLLSCIEQSLTRLRTDHVDILQLHNPTPEEVERYDCVSTLQEIQAQGKTRFIGISTNVPYVEEFLEMGVFDTFQLPYSALDPEYEGELNRVAQRGVGTIIRGAVAQGAPVVSISERRPFVKEKAKWEKVDLSVLAPQLDPMEMMLRFTLSHPNAHTVIVGTKSLGHLQDNLSAAEKGPLDAQLVKAIRAKVAAVSG